MTAPAADTTPVEPTPQWTTVVPDTPPESIQTEPTTPDVPTTDPAPEPTPASPTRDEKGRFAAKAEDTPTEEPPATEEVPEHVEPDADPTIAEGAEPVAAETPADLPAGDPWSFKVEGQQYTLGNAVVIPGKGVLVPEADLDALHRYLGRGIKADALMERTRREAEQQRASIASQKEFVTLAGSEYERLGRLVQEGKVDEAFTDLVAFAEAMPTLQARAEASVYKRQLQERDRANEPSAEAVYTSALQDADAALRDLVTQAKAHFTTAKLGDTDWQDIAQDLALSKAMLVRQAERDLPDYDLKRGDYYLDEQAASALIERAVEKHRKYTAAVAAAEQRAKQAADNARRQQSSVTAPPTATGSPTAPPKTATSKTFKSADEFYAWSRSAQL